MTYSYRQFGMRWVVLADAIPIAVFSCREDAIDYWGWLVKHAHT